MTIKEFIAELEKTPRTWRLNGDQIRNDNCQCPLEAVANKPKGHHFDAASSIGIYDNNRRDIVCAADEPLMCVVLRKRLLKACGLGEK